jgi:hypothetical protein
MDAQFVASEGACRAKMYTTTQGGPDVSTARTPRPVEIAADHERSGEELADLVHERERGQPSGVTAGAVANQHPLIAAAVDLSVLGLLLGTRHLALHGATPVT